MTLLLSKQFLIPEQFWNTEEFPYEKSWYGETKEFQQNRETPFMQEKIDTGTSLKHRRVPQGIFPVLWDKKVSTENRDLPLLCSKFFNTRN